jgi:redox-sensing transcriptional repressor
VSQKPAKVVNLPTVRRLPSYLYLLRPLRDAACAHVSGTYLAQQLKLDPVQVRKDLEVTGIVGRPRIGFPVEALIRAIEEYLGWHNTAEAFLVGVGSLGTALLGYEGFTLHGLRIIAAFDHDLSKTGREVHGTLVLPMTKLPDLAQRLHVRIGIIAVPAGAAQAVADQLVDARLTGIWNFAHTVLQVPPHVIVQNEDLSVGLAVLSKRLTAETLDDVTTG